MWLGLFSEYAGSAIANKEATRDSKNAANFVFPPMRQAKFSRLAHIYLQGFTFRLLMSLGMGMGVRTPQFLAPGTIVQVHAREAILLGEVRYCVASGAEFDAGIAVQDVVPRR